MINDLFNKMNIVLLFLCLLSIVIIVGLINHIYETTNLINIEMKNIEDKIPECPKCPKLDDIYLGTRDCPECPECPRCPIDGSSENNKCPKVECPSVNDIVSGIFPGRNPNVIDGGRYFTIDPSNTYDGLSTRNFYEKEYKFPMQKILKPDIPLRSYNIQGDSVINNSLENNLIDTNQNTSMVTTGASVSSTFGRYGYSPIASNEYASVEYLNNIDPNQRQKQVNTTKTEKPRDVKLLLGHEIHSIKDTKKDTKKDIDNTN